MAEKVLSCFWDESGDFGDYDPQSPFYIVSVILHDQSQSISSQVDGIESFMKNHGYPHHAIHAGPLIRRESDYEWMDIDDRRRMFNLLYNFARRLPIQYMSVKVNKDECDEHNDLEMRLTKAIKAEILKSEDYWRSFDKIIIYYDDGQKPLKRIINVIFNSLFSNVEIRKVDPKDYKLFQVADLICTLALANAKIEDNILSKSEMDFFGSARSFQKEYWRKIEKKHM